MIIKNNQLNSKHLIPSRKGTEDFKNETQEMISTLNSPLSKNILETQNSVLNYIDRTNPSKANRNLYKEEF